MHVGFNTPFQWPIFKVIRVVKEIRIATVSVKVGVTLMRRRGFGKTVSDLHQLGMLIMPFV
jgi:hypothetical protein